MTEKQEAALGKVASYVEKAASYVKKACAVLERDFCAFDYPEREESGCSKCRFREANCPVLALNTAREMLGYFQMEAKDENNE